MSLEFTWSLNERRLRTLAADRGWFSLNDIAAGLGVATSTLSRVVAGDSQPGEILLAAIAGTFGDAAFFDIFGVSQLDDAGSR